MNARLVLALFLVVAAAGCAVRTASIAQLKVDPRRFHDKTVQIEGVVTLATGAPRAEGTVYRIDDGSGEITVVSAVPVTLARGARVRVTGTLEPRLRDAQADAPTVQQRTLDVLAAGN